MPDYSTVYILFSCNAWMEYASMRIIEVSTDIKLLYKNIRNEIKQGAMDYCGLSKMEGVKLFDEHLEKGKFEIGDLLYGTIMSFENVDWKKPNKAEGLN